MLSGICGGILVGRGRVMVSRYFSVRNFEKEAAAAVLCRKPIWGYYLAALLSAIVPSERIDNRIPVVARSLARASSVVCLVIGALGVVGRQLSAITSARNGFGFRAK